MYTAGRLLDNSAIPCLFVKCHHFCGHLRLYGRSHRNGNWRHAKEKSLVNKQEPGNQDTATGTAKTAIFIRRDIGKQDKPGIFIKPEIGKL
jgi:hypothetical protein